MDNGINSKERVKNFGEVFTPDSIVNDMLDLVDEQLPQNSEYIDKVFLEPACGDGQFLIRILSRKMEKIQTLPKAQRQLALVKALCSIYGVDIQLDNVIRARERMFDVAIGKEVSTFDLNNKTQIIKVDLGIEYSEQLKDAVRFILNTNIIHGNTLEQPDITYSNDMFVFLTEYQFNGEMVTMAECPITSLEYRHKTYNEIHYLDMMHRKLDDASHESMNDEDEILDDF